MLNNFSTTSELFPRSAPLAVNPSAARVSESPRAERVSALPTEHDEPTVPADFVAALTHEIRGGLATMRVSLDMLEDTGADGVDSEYLVGHLQRCATWLEGLVENTQWATMDVEDMGLSLEHISVLEPVQAALALVEPVFARKEQRLTLDFPRVGPTILADSQRLGQVMVNLLTNASAYASYSDTVEIEVSTSPGWVEVRVTDHGPGVSSDEQQRIFDRYVRGEAATRGHVRGLGLGLHLAKALIESHAGVIGVDSVPGHGASFWFRLPTVDVQPRATSTMWGPNE